MKRLFSRTCKWIGLPGIVIFASCWTLAWLVISCSTNKQPGEVAAGATTASTGKGGAELWAENCVRCHNIRSPSSYSPAQWEVVMMHMRVRANLTPEEHKKILEFLKSGS
jgi:hypothetical protein